MPSSVLSFEGIKKRIGGTRTLVSRNIHYIGGQMGYKLVNNVNFRDWEVLQIN